jgi:protein-tyrosine phosphatase
MSSPSSTNKDGALKPSFFVEMFLYNKVKAVVRLNEKMYSHGEFERNDIQVFNMECPDGTNPPDEIIREFIELCDKQISKGKAIAVHCRAGLGRTGTLIGLYMMHKHGFTAKQAIAWLRLCRPGSVVGDQQQFMQAKEPDLKAIVKGNIRNAQRVDTSEEEPTASPVRRVNNWVSGQPNDRMVTPVKKQKNHEEEWDSHHVYGDQRKAEEIDANSYIHQYYL